MIVLLTAFAVVIFGVWVGNEVRLNTPLFVMLEHMQGVAWLLGAVACGVLACVCRKFAGSFRYRPHTLIWELVSGAAMTFFVEDKGRSGWWRLAGIPWPALALLYNTLSDHVSGDVSENVVPSYREHLRVFAVELLSVVVFFSAGVHCSHRYHVGGWTLDLIWAVHLFYTTLVCMVAIIVHVSYFSDRSGQVAREGAQGLINVFFLLLLLTDAVLCTVIAKNNDRTSPLFPLFWIFCCFMVASCVQPLFSCWNDLDGDHDEPNLAEN